MKTAPLLAIVLAVASSAAAATGPERIVSREQLAQVVDVRDVTATGDGTVSGTVVNHASYPIRDVRLRVEHLWLWDNEYHPGVDDYSRSEVYTIPGEIPAGASRSFTYRPKEPLETGARGRFTPLVEPMEVTEMIDSRGATDATSGVGAPYGGARPSDVPPPAAAPDDAGMRDEPIRPPY